MQDITPRNRAEEAVRAKEAFLTALVNNTDDLLLAVDRQLRITMMNDALRVAVRRNYGFELAVGDDVYRLVVPERRAELEGIFSRALQGQRQHVESAFRLPSGRQVSQDEAYNPIIDAGGNVTGVSIFVHDVSAQRRAAQTIQSIVKGTAAALGEAFFRSLVRELAAAVGARYALVGELSGDPSPQIRTVAVSGDGSILDNFGYDLSHTPCAAVIRDGIQFYPEGLGQAFPENAMLRDLGIQSYLGVPLQPSGCLRCWMTSRCVTRRLSARCWGCSPRAPVLSSIASGWKARSGVQWRSWKRPPTWWPGPTPPATSAT
jgi:PAS domain S-box-containing protein